MTGAPSICDTTQIQTNKIRTAAAVLSVSNRAAPLFLQLMEGTILEHRLVEQATLDPRLPCPGPKTPYERWLTFELHRLIPPPIRAWFPKRGMVDELLTQH